MEWPRPDKIRYRASRYRSATGRNKTAGANALRNRAAYPGRVSFSAGLYSIQACANTRAGSTIAVSLLRRARAYKAQESVIQSAFDPSLDCRYAKKASRNRIANSDSVVPETHATTS